MSPTASDILAAYRSGTLTVEEAARQLLPLLQTSGRLNLELGPDVRPVLEALRRLASPGTPRKPESRQPLTWDSPHWQRLSRVPDDFWTILRDRRLDQSLQCLRYAFTVRSAAAAAALEDWIMDHSDHHVTVDLPASFQEASGQVMGQTPARRLTKADLSTWVTWLQSIPPVPDASLTDLGIAPPPQDAG
jgi:hypothetical protein